MTNLSSKLFLIYTNDSKQSLWVQKEHTWPDCHRCTNVAHMNKLAQGCEDRAVARAMLINNVYMIVFWNEEIFIHRISSLKK